MKDTKERSIRQALHYFTRNDYDRSSLKNIAGALGITKGGIYHYFESKEELFKATVLFTLNEFEKIFLRIVTPEISFKQSLKGWFSFEEIKKVIADTLGLDLFLDYGSVIYLFFTAFKKFPEIRERLDQIYSRMLGMLSHLLEQARKNGEISDDIDLEALAFEIGAFGEGAMLLGGVIRNLNLKDMGERSFKNIWKRIKA